MITLNKNQIVFALCSIILFTIVDARPQNVELKKIRKASEQTDEALPARTLLMDEENRLLYKENAKLNEKLIELSDQIKNMKQSFYESEVFRQKNKKLNSERNRNETVLKKTEDQYQKISAEKDSYKQKADLLQKDNNAMKSSLADLNSRINFLRNIESEKQAALVKAGLLENDLNKNRKALSEAQEQLTAIKQRSEELEKKSADKSKNDAIWQKEIQDSRNTIEKLKKENSDLNEKMKIAGDQFPVLRKLQDENNVLRKAAEESKKAAENLKSQAAACQKKIDTQNQEQAGIGAKNTAAANEKIANLQASIDVLKADLVKANNNLTAQSVKKKEIEDKNEGLEKTLASLQGQTDMLNRAKDDLTKKIGLFEVFKKSYVIPAQVDAADRDKIYRILGYLSMQVGSNYQAIDFYAKALELNKTDKDSYYNLGFLYVQAGKYKEAVNAYTMALRGDISDKETYYNLSIIYGKYLKDAALEDVYYKKFQQCK